MGREPKAKTNGGANLGFEALLWSAADKLRGHMDAAEYKHVVLGLIFLKYISDAFEEIHTKLSSEKGADPEDRDEYVALNIFWVPPEARWTYLQGRAKDPLIGKLLDNAMVAIERDNSSLKGVLPKNYARPDLNKQQLGEVIDLIAKIGLGDKESRSKDILGRVYEYFLSQFASAEGKKGGQFYTPRCVVQLLVEMLAPYKGRVFDPCCGSGGMFVQSVRFVKEHATGNGNGGKAKGDISIFGQESNPTTWKLAKMNLAIRGIEADLGDENADSFHRDLHKDLKADYILANPPFNMSDWGGDRLRDDSRWKYGAPPVGNANFAWVQHFIHHLAPTGIVPLVSPDKRESFILDVSRGRIDLKKGTYQNRARQVVVLVRLDFGGPTHRNPDGVEIACPHFHVYREGYGDKWALPVPADRFPNLGDLWVTLEDFMRYCNVTIAPNIRRGLFP